MSRDVDTGDERPEEDLEWQQEDGLFDDFDSDWEPDDSDRDSDFAAIYHEDEPEDEPAYFDDPPEDEVEVGTGGPLKVAPSDDLDDGDDRDDDWPDDVQRTHADTPEEDRDTGWGNNPDSELRAATPSALPPLGAYSAAVERPAMESDFDDDDDAYEDFDEYADEPAQPTFPLGLIIVGVIALGLMVVGGYGVVQQRAALQEEVRQLQSRLATTASPAEVGKTRAVNESLQQRNDELEARLVGLERENRTLQATVAGLEKQLSAQQQALQRSPAPAVTQPPEPVAKPAPQPARPAVNPAPAPVSSGNWFVNFGSYGQEDIARSWANRLQPESGSVVVTTGDKDGRTYYRVRVIGLASRDAANATARAFESKYGLEKLWVGESAPD